MKHWTVAGLAAATLVAVASCGGSAPSRGPASYLAVGTSRVAMVQWRTTSGAHVRGTLTASDAGGSAPGEMVSANQVPFTGTVKGNSVTLTFPVMYFLHTRAQGSLSGNTLRLRLAQPDGTLKQATFSESDAARYHRALTTLHRTVRRDNAQVAGHLAAHPRKQANAHAEQVAVSTLYRDSSLAPGGVLARGLARFAAHASTTRSDLATEEHDTAGRNGYCQAAFTVAGDAQKVSGDLKNVQGDAASMLADVAVIRDEAVTAKAQARNLDRAGLATPGADAVITGAKAKLGRAIAMANSYIDQVNALGARARSITDRLATGRCSGARSGSWAPPVSRVG